MELTVDQIRKMPAEALLGIDKLSQFTGEQLELMDAELIHSLLSADNSEEADEQSLDELRTTLDVYRRFLSDNGITISITSALKSGRQYPNERLLRDFTHWHQANGVKRSLTGKSDVSDAIATIRDEVYDQEVQDLWERLQGDKDPEIYNQFSKRLGLTYGEKWALLWWLTDTKRRARDLAVKGEVDITQQVPYPVFYGKQNSGKTFIVKSFRKVFGEMSIFRKVEDILDDFGQLQYGKMLLVDFDDISQVRHSDLAHLKAWATADTLTPRMMRSEQQHFIKKISTAICSSNHPVSKVIPDTTGSRRFFEIKCQEQWVDVIRDTDFLALWQSVDDEWYPSTLLKDEIRRIQNEHQRNKHPVESFWEDAQPFKGSSSVSATALYNSWIYWAEENNHKQVTNTGFGKNVNQYLVETYGFLTKDRGSSGYKYNLTDKGRKYFELQGIKWELHDELERQLWDNPEFANTEIELMSCPKDEFEYPEVDDTDLA